MGCDGGTIPKRDELVKTKKKAEQKDKASELSFRWQHCAITQQSLAPPIVACEMGRLYSKESVIEALLDNSEENGLKDVAPHVKSLKDVKELSLTENPLWVDLVRGETGDSYIDVQKAKWICPVSGMEMNGRFRFCFLWSCGCVFSEKALKEMMKVKEEGNECPKCLKTFQFLDIITLNPTDERDIVTLQEKMSLRRIIAKDKKDAKKAASKKRLAVNATVTSTSESNGESAISSSSTASGVTSNGKSATRKNNPDNDDSPSTSKKSKIIPPPKPPTAAASTSKLMSKAGTSAYSVAKDPNASEVYKSLFTTHQSEADQGRAHWVTYNPFYN